jgi:hypothetical protein
MVYDLTAIDSHFHTAVRPEASKVAECVIW